MEKKLLKQRKKIRKEQNKCKKDRRKSKISVRKIESKKHHNDPKYGESWKNFFS